MDGSGSMMDLEDDSSAFTSTDSVFASEGGGSAHPIVPKLLFEVMDAMQAVNMADMGDTASGLILRPEASRVLIHRVAENLSFNPRASRGLYVKQNRELIQELLIYLEEDTLGTQEKLSIIRCHRGYLTAFFNFLIQLHSIPCYLLWLHLEILKETASLLSSEQLLDELAILKALYLVPSSPLEANIGRLSYQALEKCLFERHERPSIKVLNGIESDLQEMNFGCIVSAVGYFPRIKDDDALLQGSSLRSMSVMGRGLSSVRSKDGVRRQTQLIVTPEKKGGSARGMVSSAFSELELMVINSQFGKLYSMLYAIRKHCENSERYTQVCQFLMLICVPYLKTIPFLLDVSRRESRASENVNALIYLPVTQDLLSIYFYGNGLFGVEHPMLACWSACREFSMLVELSQNRDAKNFKEKTCAQAVVCFAGLLNNLLASLEFCSPSFRWLLSVINAQRPRSGSALFVLVFGECLLSPSLLDPALTDGIYYFGIFRDVLIKLVEHGVFFSSPETDMYNNFIRKASSTWDKFWDSWLSTDRGPDLDHQKAIDEHLSLISVEERRGTAAFSAIETCVINVLLDFELDILEEANDEDVVGLKLLFDHLADDIEYLHNTVIGTSVAQQDHSDQGRGRLQFASGDMINIFAYDPDGMARGQHTKTGETGIFPARLVSHPQLPPASLSSQLKEVLSKRMREFQAYLSKTLCEEPLLFWLEASQSELSLDLCSSLCHKFVVDGARCQISFSREAMQKMIDATSDSHPDLKALDLALGMLLAEVSSMLHNYCLEFLSNDAAVPSALARSASDPLCVPSSPQAKGTEHRQQNQGNSAIPRDMRRTTSGGLAPHVTGARKLSLSGTLKGLTFRGKRKGLEDAALMPVGEKTAFLLRRYKEEFTAFLEANHMSEAMACYLLCLETLRSKGKRVQIKIDELRAMGPIASSATDSESVEELLKHLEAELYVSENVFIGNLLADVKD